MKLEENMYVRTLKGIVKIDEIKEDVMKDTKGYLHYGDFIKASYNIIDLIEVGDYVNGKEVAYIDEFGKYIAICETDITTRDFEGRYEFKKIKEEDIETLVTKERFEQMQYKVGD